MNDCNELNTFQIKVVPNPAQKFVNIEFENTSKKGVIYLTDVLGRTVILKQLEDIKGKTKIQLSLENISPGVYSLNVHTEKGNGREKLVIE